MDPGDSKNVYENPRLQRPNFSLKYLKVGNFQTDIWTLYPRVPIYIFGIPRVHRLLLCIWFPRDTPVLTLIFVKRLRAVSSLISGSLRNNPDPSLSVHLSSSFAVASQNEKRGLVVHDVGGGLYQKSLLS